MNKGQDLRIAVFENNFEMVKKLVEGNADVNYAGENNSTLLNEAIRNENLEIIKYLLDNGADTRIADKYGYTAYHEACKTKKANIINSIKLKSESKYNEREYLVDLLRENIVPEEVINYLDMERKYIKVDNSEWINYIEVSALDEVRIFNYNGIKYVDLLAKVENYSNIGVIAWIPEKKTFGYFDYETGENGIFEYMTWNEFLEIPGYYIDKVFNL